MQSRTCYLSIPLVTLESILSIILTSHNKNIQELCKQVTKDMDNAFAVWGEGLSVPRQHATFVSQEVIYLL